MRVVALALVLAGCGGSTNGEAPARCGWRQLPNPEPATECRMFVTHLDGCGLLPPDGDPCAVSELLPKLRVESGQALAEWRQDGVPVCDFASVACQSMP